MRPSPTHCPQSQISIRLRGKLQSGLCSHRRAGKRCCAVILHLRATSHRVSQDTVLSQAKTTGDLFLQQLPSSARDHETFLSSDAQLFDLSHMIKRKAYFIPRFLSILMRRCNLSESCFLFAAASNIFSRPIFVSENRISSIFLRYMTCMMTDDRVNC